MKRSSWPSCLAPAFAASLLLVGCSSDRSSNTAIEARVLDLESRLSAAQATLSALQGRTLTIEAGQSALRQDVNAIAGNNVLALGPYLTVDVAGKPLATLSGINLQLVNGAGNTWTANGLGNLVIGYNETGGGLAHCSIGTDSAGVPILEAAACAAATGTWGIGMRTGSHYVVIGSYHDYTATAGAVFGIGNVADAEGASVLGGGSNHASAWYATVSGGNTNSARGTNSSVAGGFHNVASGQFAGVAGGWGNTATGNNAMISGGAGGTASGYAASVAGGYTNTAGSDWSAVLGGNMLSASTTFQSVPATP